MTAPITYDPVNNVRFLVRGVAQRPNLASKALAHSVKALAAPWREHFGYEPLLCETFTDIESHEGTCYKAAGWTPLGMTEGHSRQRADFYVPNDRPKKLWIKPLRSDARERLCAKTLAPEHAAGETIGKGAPLPITAKELQPLAKTLCSVRDNQPTLAKYFTVQLTGLPLFGVPPRAATES